VLVRLAAVFEEDFLWAGTRGAESESPRGLRGLLEEGKRSDGVDRSPPEMERARAPTNTAIATRSASTACECEARMLSQELQDMSPSVGTEPLQQVQLVA
jgi:hypothetical protein